MTTDLTGGRNMARTSIARVATALVVATTTLALVAAVPAGAARVPAVQKITVKLTGACADKKMVEANNETQCTVSVTVTPRTPTRSFTLQELEPAKGAKWTAIDKVKSAAGKATFELDAMVTEDEDEYYRDGAYKFRVTAIRTKKEKAFTGSSMTITFVPDDSGSDDSGDDDSDDTTATTNPNSTPTTPGGGHTPTTPTTPGGGSQAWFTGATVDQMGAFCMPADPTMYAGATICSGITSQKTLAQFTELISPLPNAMPSFRRNSFCMQALSAMSSLTLAQRQTKCQEANAGGM